MTHTFIKRQTDVNKEIFETLEQCSAEKLLKTLYKYIFAVCGVAFSFV